MSDVGWDCPRPMPPPSDLDRRLAMIDRLPLTWEGRLLARLAARLNALDELPAWLPHDECARLGEAVVSACHAAKVPVSEIRPLVDPGAAEWARAATQIMRPRD